MTIIINPGTGPVAGASYFYAKTNMAMLLVDAGGHSLTEIKDPDLGDGRFRFFGCFGGRWHEIDMPGLPLAEVRYMGDEGQNIWDFPRLYVDGSSWVWKYAIRAVIEHDDEDHD